MDPHATTYRQALERLRDQGLVSTEQIVRAEETLGRGMEHTPVFVAVIFGVGAWLAGLLFTGCFGLLMHELGAESDALFMAGLGYLFGATMLRRAARHTFFIQAALALAVTGYVMALIGTHEARSYGECDGAMAAVAVLLAAVVGWVNPCPVLRFMLPVAATGFVLNWLVDGQLPLAAGALVAAQLAGLTVLLLRFRYRPGSRVLAHALLASLAIALTVIFVQGEHASSYFFFFGRYHESSVGVVWRAVSFSLTLLSAAWLAWLIGWLARRVLPEAERAHWHRHPFVRAGWAAGVVLAAFSNLGIVVFTGVLLLGYGVAERYICSGALLCMTASLIHLFVELHDGALGPLSTPLTLLVSGGVFLGLRRWLPRSGPLDVAPAEASGLSLLSARSTGLIWGGAVLIFALLNLLALSKVL
jgi:hypothetical protein